MAGLTQSELDDLAQTLEALDVKPDSGNPEEFKKWVLTYAESLNRESHRESRDPNTGQMVQNPVQSNPPVNPSVPSHGQSPSNPGLSTHDSTHNSPTPIPLSGVPKLVLFSGDRKGEILFDQWRYEVECLQTDGYSENVICLAIRRSLRGPAGRVLMRLGPNATVDEIMYKLDSIYGTVEEKETLMANFYSARQQESEDISAWGCRLEDLLSKAIIQGLVNPDDENDMLRNMFWSGMKSSLKYIAGHLYDKYTDFDGLRRAMRILEEDKEKRKSDSDKPVPAKRTTVEKDKEETEELRTIVNRLSTELEEMRKEREYGQYRGRTMTRGHYSQRYRAPTRFRGQSSSYRFQAPQSTGFYNSNSQGTRFHDPSQTATDDVVCWRCGQKGHLQIGCRVDHLRGNLNGRRPSARGRRQVEEYRASNINQN